MKVLLMIKPFSMKYNGIFYRCGKCVYLFLEIWGGILLRMFIKRLISLGAALVAMAPYTRFFSAPLRMVSSEETIKL